MVFMMCDFVVDGNLICKIIEIWGCWFIVFFWEICGVDIYFEVVNGYVGYVVKI